MNVQPTDTITWPTGDGDVTAVVFSTDGADEVVVRRIDGVYERHNPLPDGVRPATSAEINEYRRRNPSFP